MTTDRFLGWFEVSREIRVSLVVLVHINRLLLGPDTSVLNHFFSI